MSGCQNFWNIVGLWGNCGDLPLLYIPESFLYKQVKMFAAQCYWMLLDNKMQITESHNVWYNFETLWLSLKITEKTEFYLFTYGLFIYRAMCVYIVEAWMPLALNRQQTKPWVAFQKQILNWPCELRASFVQIALFYCSFFCHSALLLLLTWTRGSSLQSRCGY